jgi:glycine oxidase
MDFVIIGAGINGLLLARELAAVGADVLVVEKGSCCREASWAGGGIVSPLYPWRYGQPVTALASWAQDFYPQLAAALHDNTGIDPEFSQTGLLMLDADDENEALLWAKLNKRRMEQVDSDFVYRHEPRLAPGFKSGLWMPDVANIRNPRLGQALVAELSAKSNVKFSENSQVSQFETRDGRIRAVEAETRIGKARFVADTFVLCAGAWSGQLAELTDIELAVEPVKGQMLLYYLPESPVTSIVLTGGRYIIPRRDGYLLAGSTLEYQQFDKTPTSEARHSLLQSAQDLLPLLKEVEPVSQWAGLRPAAPGGVPYIGKLPGFENFYVNAGQFRNGLVLAPASARLLADLVLKREPIIDPAPYQPGVPAEKLNK